MFNIKMDMIQTVGLAVIILIVGRILRTKVRIFIRNNKLNFKTN